MTNHSAPCAHKNLRWLEARVQVDGEAAEAVSDFFNRVGSGGAVLEELVPEGAGDDERTYWVKSYLPVGRPEEEQQHRQRIEEGLWHLGQLLTIPEPQFRLLEYQDWAEAWKASYKPIPLGRRLVIKPGWCQWKAEADQVIIEIDPGQAFGTGLHPSTQLALAGLEDWIRRDDVILDLGSGSGILAIAAVRLGAKHALALDLDPLSVAATLENAAGNGVADQITTLQGSLPPSDSQACKVVQAASRIAPGGFHLMLINILAEVIASLIEEGLGRWLAPHGTMILAGIIQQREQIVIDSLSAAEMRVVERRQDGDWVSLIARRMGAPGRR